MSLSFALLSCSLSLAASEESAASPPAPKAVYAVEGIKRITENIRALDENIKDIQSNLANIDKNIQTMTGELADLRTLLEEYSTLKSKFLAKIALSKDEMTRNSEALQKLQRFSRTLDSARRKQVDQQTVKIQQESATREIAERERWNLDASHKLRRLQDLLSDLEQSTKNLRARQPNLEKEIGYWRKQTVEFQTALDTFKEQRDELNDLLAVRNAAGRPAGP
ncbi:MAG: hypothetical protein HYR96_10485 [Deltaproteobacteria bacterium]|nr:hypothetical protein [Deltaproteobacteria bacterium]MBI3293555.1 hypothetical protein [Deltaproteobacteria bacterium]